MRILLTGATGFAGGFLAEALLARNAGELFGVSRHAGWPAHWRHLADHVHLQACDLCSLAAVEALLRQVQPVQIYHLAGYSSPAKSVREPDEAWAGNLTATRTLCDAVVRWGGRPRILFVSSGQVYGASGNVRLAQDENCVFRPTNPYATSKAAADLLCYQYTVNPGLDIIRVRPFNHIGPRQSPEYAVAHFAKQLAAIQRGSMPPILETGDLTPRRDLSDVRDVVAAYLLLMDKGRRGEAYNVASGQVVSIREVLDRLIALAGVTVEVRQRQDLLRANELTVAQLDTTKVRRETGWSSRIPLEQTLAETLAYWRSLASGAC